MDRFERTMIVMSTTASRNLHSNMDRFESISRSAYISMTMSIYIPIWIDLKEIPFCESRKNHKIYIPIWIDLKERAW